MAYNSGGIDFDVFEVLDDGNVRVSFTRPKAAMLASRALTFSAIPFTVDVKVSSESTEWTYVFPERGVHCLRMNADSTL